MKQVLTDLFTSKKFLAALTAIIVYLGGRFGLHVDPTALDHIWHALLIYVGAQGVADMGKSAAQITASAGVDVNPAPGSGPTGAALSTAAVLMFVLLGAGAALLPSCATARERGDAAASAFLDCETPDIDKVLPDLVPLAKEALLAAIGGDGTIDTTQLRADAAAIRSDLGKCVLAGAVAAVSSSPAAPPLTGETPRVAAHAPDPTQLSAAFASIRSDLGWKPIHVSGAVF